MISLSNRSAIKLIRSDEFEGGRRKSFIPLVRFKIAKSNTEENTKKKKKNIFFIDSFSRKLNHFSFTKKKSEKAKKTQMLYAEGDVRDPPRRKSQKHDDSQNLCEALFKSVNYLTAM